jgi:hypothetical protein
MLLRVGSWRVVVAKVTDLLEVEGESSPGGRSCARFSKQLTNHKLARFVVKLIFRSRLPRQLQNCVRASNFPSTKV